MPPGKLAPSLRPRRAGSPARRVVTLLGCAVALAGCGAVRVQPTTPSGSSKLASRGRVDSPLTSMDNHVACIRKAHMSVRVVNPTELQIGAASTGPTIVFAATAGAAQNYQIVGDAQGAEIIGTALLYPHQGSDRQLTSIEACLSQGVQG